MAMNGSYHLATYSKKRGTDSAWEVGLHAGQPAYMKADGLGHAIRYWPREERWLVDLDGLPFVKEGMKKDWKILSNRYTYKL